MKKILKSQAGFSHILLVVAVVVLVGTVGTVVYGKSKADTYAGKHYVTATCNLRLHNAGRVYASAVGTKSKFKNARDSDSIRNLAIGLCGTGYLSRSTAAQLNKTGNSNNALQSAYKRFEQGTAKYSGSNKDGVPGPKSITYLGLKAYGF